MRSSVVVGVANASLSVERGGAISVLMGLSGSGKSTLLRAANGLNLVTRGQVLVGDGDTIVDIGVTCDPATLRRIRRLRVAMVFQQFGLLPWRTVRNNVGLGLELRGDSSDKRRRIIDRHLELVGLSQWGERYCSELSGGMQQRVRTGTRLGHRCGSGRPAPVSTSSNGRPMTMSPSSCAM
jgi:glycine betaine/proline transport system ATP-binding protein